MSMRGRRRGGNVGASNLVIIESVPIDDWFSSPRQIRCCPPGSPLAGKLLVANYGDVNSHIRNPDLSFYSKFYGVPSFEDHGINADSLNIYTSSWATGTLAIVRKRDINTGAIVASSARIDGMRMIDSGDPLHVYVTSNNGTDGHGVRMITKSTMTVTTVGGNPVQILATGTGDNQFTNPLGVLYIATNADSGFLYICEETRIVKIAVVTTAGSESFTWNTSYAIPAYDICFDGTNFYTQRNTATRKFDASFNEVASITCVGYSITYIPDQGDGYGATLGIVNSINPHLERRKCSDLSAINSVGSSGDGSSSLFDPTFTTAVATDIIATSDDGISQVMTRTGTGPYTYALSLNGFAAAFHRTPGPHKWTFRVNGGLGLVTAMDGNTDTITSTKNIPKCNNLTSLKLQTNVGQVLNLSFLSTKLAIVWAYGCGAGITGSIRHMLLATSINLRENGASQAQVDAWIDDLWQNRDVMAICAVDLNGTNTAPSGVYQEATPPTTGNEKVFDLVENYGWTVATS